MGVWYAIVKPVEAFVSWILPTGLRCYAFESPITDLDGMLEIGVCLLLQGQQLEPGYVVCNVGHIPQAHFGDLRSTVRSSLEIMKELHSDAPGFVSNVLCVLPRPPRGQRGCCTCKWDSVREINLSVWSKPEDAAAWYRSSREHKRIVADHQTGGLKVFGNLLASLEPTRLHWQRRCKRCAAVAE